MKIIINADDLGHSLAINDRIFRLIETGHITSATLLTNAPWYEDAVGRLRSYPHASISIGVRDLGGYTHPCSYQFDDKAAVLRKPKQWMLFGPNPEFRSRISNFNNGMFALR